MEKKRLGDTIITSVSLSKSFKDIIKKFNISPTEAIRKGIAIELYEMGVPQYISNLNKDRSEVLKKFFKDKEYQLLLKDIKNLEKSIKLLKEKLK